MGFGSLWLAQILFNHGGLVSTTPAQAIPHDLEQRTLFMAPLLKLNAEGFSWLLIYIYLLLLIIPWLWLQTHSTQRMRRLGSGFRPRTVVFHPASLFP